MPPYIANLQGGLVLCIGGLCQNGVGVTSDAASAFGAAADRLGG